MCADYERRHPNVRIHWVDIPFSEGPKRTLTAMLSSRVPDVVNLNPDFSAILASRGALTDMRRALPPEKIAEYLPVAWDAATLRRTDGASITFGVPWYITSGVTLYHRGLLRRAGFSRPPATFDALPAFVGAIKRRTGAYGLMPPIAEGGHLLKELQKTGVTLWDTTGRAVFATDRAANLLTHYVAMYRAGLIPAEALTEGHQAAVGRYQAGTLAMLSIGPNFLKIVKENAPDIYKETGVAPQFPQDAPYKDFALMVLSVPEKSAHPKEAVDFAAFVTNAENQYALAQVAPVLPSVTRALARPYFTRATRGDLMAEGRRISALQLLRAKDVFRVRPEQHAVNETVDYYAQMALLGKLTPKDALRKAEAAINQVPPCHSLWLLRQGRGAS